MNSLTHEMFLIMQKQLFSRTLCLTNCLDFYLRTSVKRNDSERCEKTSERKSRKKKKNSNYTYIMVCAVIGCLLVGQS